MIDQPIIDAAAAALDLAPLPSRSRRRLLTVLAFALLMLAAAVVAGYVFRAELAAILNS